MSPGETAHGRAARLLAGLFTPMLTCREGSDLLLRRVDQGLPLLKRVAFDRHLAMCDSCKAYVDSYRTTIELGRAAFRGPGESAPPGALEYLVRDLLAAVRRPGLRASWDGKPR